MNLDKEFIDYENVTRISNEIKNISKKMEEILTLIDTEMQNINTIDYFKSNASFELLNKFNASSKNFHKFYKELEVNSLYLDRKVIEYGIRTGTSSDYINETTSSYLERLERI